MHRNDTQRPLLSASDEAGTDHVLLLSDRSWRSAWQKARIAAYGVGACWMTVIAAYFINFRQLEAGDPSAWGQFGDYVGGVLNPVVGAITLIGVVVTVLLQRELLERTQEANLQQSLLGQHEAFDSAVFHLMAAIDRRGTEVTMVLDGGVTAALKKTREYNANYPLKGGRHIDTTGEYEFRGVDAFHAMLAKINYDAESRSATARSKGESDQGIARSAAVEAFAELDYAIGPSMRQLGDVLRLCAGFQAAYDRAVATHLRALNPPAFYARMAMNSLPVEELEVFSIYVGVGLGGSTLLAATQRYEIFADVPHKWVRNYFS